MGRPTGGGADEAERRTLRREERSEVRGGKGESERSERTTRAPSGERSDERRGASTATERIPAAKRRV